MGIKHNKNRVSVGREVSVDEVNVPAADAANFDRERIHDPNDTDHSDSDSEGELLPQTVSGVAAGDVSSQEHGRSHASDSPSKRARREVEENLKRKRDECGNDGGNVPKE